MTDSLLDRATYAIEQSRVLREQRRMLADNFAENWIRLRLLVAEIAMLQAEARAHRENKQ